mmetsp:Transcript_17084/g.49352  ORF Transcript_17084/g.49352 Transcript_17084/m.49352 type:complete len:87 (+) Transcript_17084:793-1053(+)
MTKLAWPHGSWAGRDETVSLGNSTNHEKEGEYKPIESSRAMDMSRDIPASFSPTTLCLWLTSVPNFHSPSPQSRNPLPTLLPRSLR